MRRLALVLLVALAACAPDENPLRLVTIESPETLGLSLRELPPAVLKSIGLSYGLAVVKAGSQAERAGLRIGDVVYGVNQRRIANLEEFSRLIAETAEGNFGLLVRRGKSDFYVAMDLAGPPRPADGPPKLGPPARDTLLRT